MSKQIEEVMGLVDAHARRTYAHAEDADSGRAEIEAKLRELLPVWQPIESAPKDGTEIFVRVPGDSVFPTAASYKTRAYFEKEYGDAEYMEEGWYWAYGYPSDFHEDVIRPTHWMQIHKDPE